MTYETNDKRWYSSGFTLRFCESDDLIHWRKLGVEYIYGKDTCGACPGLYYDEEQDWIYLLYGTSITDRPCPPGAGETRIARSKDLITWQEAPAGRPVVTFDLTRDIDASLWPFVKECSDVDLELCEFEGKTIVCWGRGNQQGPGIGCQAIFDGPMNVFMRAFFE